MTKEEFNYLKSKYSTSEYGDYQVIFDTTFSKRLIIAVKYRIYAPSNYKRQFIEISKAERTVYGVNGDIIKMYNAGNHYVPHPTYKIVGKNFLDELNFFSDRVKVYDLCDFQVIFNPGFKQLIKELKNSQICTLGLCKLINHWILRYTTPAPNVIEALFKLKPKELKELTENCDTEFTINTIESVKLLKTLFSTSIKDACKYLKIVPDYIRLLDIKEALKSKVDSDKMRKHLRYTLELSNNPNTNINIYLDYLQMRDELDVNTRKNYPTYPKDCYKIRQLHDEVLYIINKERERIRAAKQAEKQQNYLDKYYEEAKKLEISDDTYSIIAVKDLMDLIKEGQDLYHCVGSYINSVSNGREFILFLRKNEDINTPYFTVDVTSDGKVRQIHGKHNCNVTKEIKPFIQKWADKFHLDISYCSGIYCAL